MKTRKFRYLVDTDQFQTIREQGLLYVDKTDMMYDLANWYRYVFLARPRRFGKSLLCNTFKAYSPTGASRMPMAMSSTNSNKK